MKHTIHYYICSFCVIYLLLLGCESNHEGLISGGDKEEGSVYIKIAFNMGDVTSLTRGGGPIGGENGDIEHGDNKDKVGYGYENEINDLTLFLYKSRLGEGEMNKNGVNFVDPATPVRVIYFPKDQLFMSYDNNGIINGAHTAVVALNDVTYDTTYDLLAAVNMGNSWMMNRPGLTMGDLLSATIDRSAPTDVTGGAWSIEVKDVNGEKRNQYSNFRMVSAGRSDVRDFVRFTKDNNSKDKPAVTTSIQVERLAARIEVKHNMSKGYVLDNGDKVVVKGIAIVNKWMQGSYFLKRVSDDLISTNGVTYLGKETNVNWVVDPIKTEAKTASHYMSSTYFPNLVNNKDFENEIKRCEYYDPTIKHAWHLAGYALENINHVIGDERESYSTGLVFKTLYVPKDKSKVAADGSFFKYGDNIYASLSKAMDDIHGRDWRNPMGDRVGDINRYIQGLKVNGPTGYREFLMDEIKGMDENTVILKDLSWKAFVRSRYGYEEDENGDILQGCLQNATVEHRRDLSKNGFTRTFLHGFCYYTWWIKHNNNGDDQTYGPMEFAIVRNNIYRLEVNSISSIGDDVPGQTSLDVKVSVKNWNRLDDESITIR